MKLYAIRDRLLDFFQRPFVGDNDNDVRAAMSSLLATGERLDFQQAPDHFEIWQLAEINQETGTVKPDPKFICNCADLLRRSFRQGREPASEKGAPATRQSDGGAQGPPEHPGAHDRPPEDAP